MEFKEIEGDRTKSKLLETTDHHIYRRNVCKQSHVMRSAKYKDKNYAHFYQGMVECAKKIKAHQTRALRVCHLCRAPAKSFIEIRGTYQTLENIP